MSVPAHVAAIRVNGPEDGVDQRRFARTVPAEDRNPATGWDRQVEILDDTQLPVSGGQPGDLEHVRYTSWATWPRYALCTPAWSRTSSGLPVTIHRPVSIAVTESHHPNTIGTLCSTRMIVIG